MLEPLSPEKPTISAEYLAGFIDGEGYLGILRIANGNRHPYRRSPAHPFKVYNRSPEHIVRVQVSNTNLSGLKAIHANYGGSLKPMTTPNRPRNRQAYKITWNSRLAERILEIVGPFLILKRPQYLMLLDFLTHRRKNARVRPAGPLDPEVIALRDEYHRRLKDLNRKGPREGDDQALSRERGLVLAEAGSLSSELLPTQESATMVRGQVPKSQ